MQHRRRLCLQRTTLAAMTLVAACAVPPPPSPASDLWFIFLETGRATPNDKDAVAAMQRGHIDNFKRLFAQGRLLAAGPMADPAKHKRGLVIVRAASLAELQACFQPDEYVREGYLQINAQRALARAAVHTEGIDASRVEELRIVLIGRPAGGEPAGTTVARQAALQRLVDAGTAGAWYSLQQGPVAEVLLARGTDTPALQTALAPVVAAGPAVSLDIWRQWISPGVVGPR